MGDLPIIFVISTVLLLSKEVQGHWTSAYLYEDDKPPSNPRWMLNLPDNLPITSVSIPGTHETLSKNYGGIISHCQTLSLLEQLDSGIRCVDIRCRHINNSFAIHHGIIFMHLMFGDVLQVVESFLKKNPSETVLMRIKEEYTAEGNTRTFEDTFRSYVDQFPNLFWTPSTSRSNQPYSVQLSELRGKLVVLVDFPTSNSTSTKWGLSYDQMEIQDHYKLSNNWDLYDKWEGVKGHLDKTSGTSHHDGKIYINYLSAAYGVFPFFAASGHLTPPSGASRLSTGLTTVTSKDTFPDFPRVDCILGQCLIAFEGINILTITYIREYKPKYVGIVMADFPGFGLIQEIIGVNNNHVVSRSSLSWLDSELALKFIGILSFIFLVVVCMMLLGCRRIILTNNTNTKYHRFLDL